MLAMHFFVARLLSITVINETYVCHVQSLHLMNWLIYYTDIANKIKHANVQHVC